MPSRGARRGISRGNREALSPCCSYCRAARSLPAYPDQRQMRVSNSCSGRSLTRDLVERPAVADFPPATFSNDRNLRSASGGTAGRSTGRAITPPRAARPSRQPPGRASFRLWSAALGAGLACTFRRSTRHLLASSRGSPSTIRQDGPARQRGFPLLIAGAATLAAYSASGRRCRWRCAAPRSCRPPPRSAVAPDEDAVRPVAVTLFPLRIWPCRSQAAAIHRSRPLALWCRSWCRRQRFGALLWCALWAATAGTAHQPKRRRFPIRVIVVRPWSPFLPRLGGRTPRSAAWFSAR